MVYHICVSLQEGMLRMVDFKGKQSSAPYLAGSMRILEGF